MNEIRSWIQRNQVALVIVFAMGILLALGYLRWDDARAQSYIERTDFYGDNLIDARLLELDKRALDEAYHAQLQKLWGVWIAGGVQDPKYFQNGLSKVRRAYSHASKQISDRERALTTR